MMRVVVTGASGFVGRFVSRALAGRGVEVLAAGRAAKAARTPTEVPVVLGPEASSGQLSAVLEGASAVVHLAAVVHDVAGAASKTDYLRVNRDFPLRVAEAAEKAAVPRFVFLSTAKVNGDGTRPGAPFREDSPVQPDGPYAESKWQAEERLRELSSARGIQTRIVRTPLVYGAGVRANFHSLMRWVKSGIPLPFAGFDNARSFVYVENLADLLVRLAVDAAGPAVSRTYFVSDGEDVSTAELVRRIARALHVAPRLVAVPESVLRLGFTALRRGRMADRLIGSLQVDGGLVRRELGWSPPCSLDEGLSRTAAWFAGTS
jgi:nucleoside-diphosphate-sugar epimerase